MIPTIEQQPEHVPRGLVRRAALVIVIGIVLSVLATVLLGRFREQAAVSTRPPANLDTDIFFAPTQSERDLRQADAHLRSYGWVDRQSGIVHVPIDVAIEAYLAERAR